MDKALVTAVEIGKEYGEKFGRDWGLIEEYPANAGDSDITIVTQGTVTSTARIVIDELREQGESVKLVKLRLFRPFPKEDVVNALKASKKVVVVDRNISYGFGGIFCQEIKAAFCNIKDKPLFFNVIAGLGGRDITPDTIREIYNGVKDNDYPSQDFHWVGLRTKAEEA
ncbi:MAG: hypothetical protein GY850_28710 [bacterium]|nr:hypothetical protein [bacterium]